jgi:hypothetical protein
MPDNEPDWSPEWPAPEQVFARLSRCLERLRDHDAYLLERGHEQAITHRLAMYMQDEFPGWHVDVEFNRNRDDSKHLNYRRETDDFAADHNIRPDIIVHQRGTQQHLLIVEAKRKGQPTADDVEKLKRTTEPEGEFQYAFGALVELTPGPEPCKVRWFHLGTEDTEDA